MVNYNNGKIYKIEPLCEHDEGEIYIGSTTKERLCSRMVQHRAGYKRWLLGNGDKVMAFDIFKKYGIENCKMILLEMCSCNTKDELLARERYYIKLNPCVNKIVAGRQYKEYYQDNKEKIQNYKKQYAITHKDHMAEYHSIYRTNNKESLSVSNKIYREDNKEIIAQKNKTFYDNNKEMLSHRHKDYYEINKETRLLKVAQYRELNKYPKLCVYCDCYVSKCLFSRHCKSIKHINHFNYVTNLSKQVTKLINDFEST